MPRSETDQPDNVINLPGASEADQPIADDDVAGQIEKATARLLTEIPDPAVRYQVAVGLKDRLPWVQAVSAAQLIEEGDYKTATDRLGVSRTYLDRLIREHEQPTPRKRSVLEASPAYWYGRLLGVYSLLADRHDRAVRGGRAGVEYDKHERNALAAPHLLPAIARSADRWLRRIPAAQRDEWQQRIEKATADVPLNELPARLSLKQQGQALLGQANARIRKDISEIRAEVPADASRATATAVWLLLAAQAGYDADVVGKDDASDPIVQIDHGDRYVLQQPAGSTVVQAVRWSATSP